MNHESENSDVLWIISEICYYLGLMLAVFIPVLALMLWLMSLLDQADPNYWYMVIAWVLSVLMFLVGVGLKNYIYSKNGNHNGV